MVYWEPVSSGRAGSSLWLASATRSAVTYALKIRRAAAGVGPVVEVVAAAVVPQPCRDSSSPRAAGGRGLPSAFAGYGRGRPRARRGALRR